MSNSKILTVICPLKNKENIQRFIHSFNYSDEFKCVFVIDHKNHELIQTMSLLTKLHLNSLEIHVTKKKLSGGIVEVLNKIDSKYIKIMETHQWCLEQDMNLLVKKLRKTNVDIVDCDWMIANKGELVTSSKYFNEEAKEQNVRDLDHGYVPFWHALFFKTEHILKFTPSLTRNLNYKLGLAQVLLTNAKTISKVKMKAIRVNNRNNVVKSSDIELTDMKTILSYVARNIKVSGAKSFDKTTVDNFQRLMDLYQKKLKRENNGKIVFYQFVDYVEKNNKNLWNLINKKWKFFNNNKLYY